MCHLPWRYLNCWLWCCECCSQSQSRHLMGACHKNSICRIILKPEFFTNLGYSVFQRITEQNQVGRHLKDHLPGSSNLSWQKQSGQDGPAEPWKYSEGTRIPGCWSSSAANLNQEMFIVKVNSTPAFPQRHRGSPTPRRHHLTATLETSRWEVPRMPLFILNFAFYSSAGFFFSAHSQLTLRDSFSFL